MTSLVPQEAVTRDGRRVLIRPFEERDTQALFDFFQRLPDEIRRFAWDRIDDPRLVESWGLNIDYGRVFPLLAFEGPRIVADASLHRRDTGPLRLVGRIKWLIDVDYRNVGLGTLLVNNLINAGRTQGLRHLTCMLISDLEKDAIRVLVELGFEAISIPRYGTDPDGGQHDMTKLVLEL